MMTLDAILDTAFFTQRGILRLVIEVALVQDNARIPNS